MRVKQSVRDKSLKASMAYRISTIEALLASQMPPLECPERTVRTLPDGTSINCGRPVTTITEQDIGNVYTCDRCAKFYLGDQRDIDATDRIRIALELHWSEDES